MSKKLFNLSKITLNTFKQSINSQNRLTSSLAFISLNQKKEKLKLETNFKENHFEFSFEKSKKLFKDLPYIWLRDNCRCSKCYNSLVQEVELDLQRIPIDLKPLKIENDSNDSIVKITWQDGHESEYNLFELANVAFENELAEMSNSNKVLWNKKTLNELDGLKSFEYNQYLSDETVLRDALKSIVKYGAVLIHNVPAKLREIVTVSERIAKIQGSIFGPGDCVVTNQMGFVDRAYTNLALKAHNDNTFLKNTAGLEAFHVVTKADKGGESLLIDGFYCAEKLRKYYPKEFEILTTTMVKYNFYKKDQYDLRHTDTIIKLNPLNKNEFAQIRYTAYLQQMVNHLKNKDEILNFYKALKLFVAQIEDPTNHLWLSLESNQVIIFDNFRMLHGRSEFVGNRTLVTSYMSQDEYLSKAHILGVY